MSFIKSWLDISPVSATSQKSWCESIRALLFSDRQMLEFERDGNNKARCPATAGQGF